MSDYGRAIEDLAQILHESGRKAVEQLQVYRSDLPVKPFCEWADLPNDAKNGRRMMAEFLVDRYDFDAALARARESRRP